MSLTPKEIFRRTQAHREALEKFVTTKEADAARDAALLEFVNRQPRNLSMQESWDAHAKLVGAREILEILFSLHLPEQEMKRDRLQNLQPPK